MKTFLRRLLCMSLVALCSCVLTPAANAAPAHHRKHRHSHHKHHGFHFYWRHHHRHHYHWRRHHGHHHHHHYLGSLDIDQSLVLKDSAPAQVETGLQGQLAGTKWRIDQKKTFTLHADGRSTSNWTPRGGHWKVIDASTVELDINNTPSKGRASISDGGTTLTWLGREESGKASEVARKIGRSL